MRKLAIIGASGHGKVVADIARKNGYEEIVVLDDDERIHECGGYPVIGKSSEVGTIDADVIIGIGNAGVRERIQESIPNEKIATLIHPNAVIAEDVVIGAGTVIMAGAVINPGVRIGKVASLTPVRLWITIVKWAIMYISLLVHMWLAR